MRHPVLFAVGAVLGLNALLAYACCRVSADDPDPDDIPFL